MSKAQVRSAVEATNKTGPLVSSFESRDEGRNFTFQQRRETLLVLMRATRSSSTVLKTLAADNIQHLFQDFPDLEEQAINAIYDLCEDQDQEVRVEASGKDVCQSQFGQIRIQGYKAISRISSIERRLVKRNADVLLQLLQSGEK